MKFKWAGHGGYSNNKVFTDYTNKISVTFYFYLQHKFCTTRYNSNNPLNHAKEIRKCPMLVEEDYLIDV